MNTDISVLETAASFWEILGYISTVIVVVGVVGEYVTEFTKLVSSEQLKQRVAKFSVLVLIVGLAAEIICQVQANNRNSLIAAWLNDRAARAENDAADAKLELAKIKEDRVIDPKTVDALVTNLRPLGPNRYWIIVQTNGSPGFSEQQTFADQLSSVLAQARWIKDPHTTNDKDKADPATTAVGDAGCQVSIASNSSLARAQAVLLEGLSKSFIHCKARPDASLAPDTIVVEIGPHGI